jgi:hypothetical protein
MLYTGKPKFLFLWDHLKWSKIWDMLFPWAFGQDHTKKSVNSLKTQNQGFTVHTCPPVPKLPWSEMAIIQTG